MKLVAISNVKNERDIVEAFVRHTAALVDHHIVLDNGSTDGSRDILAALVEEGLALTIFDDPSPGAWQARRMTRLMQIAANDHGADWVLPLDADEFVVAEDTRSLASILGSSGAPIHVPWRTYVPHHEDDEAQLNPVLRIRHRLAVEGHMWSKVMVPRHLASVSVLDQGSHDLVGGGEGRSPSRPEELCLAHFPIRSAAQYARKVAIGKIQYFAREHAPGLAFHYDEPLALLMRDWGEFAASFREAAAYFAIPPGVAFDPVLVDDPIEYGGKPLTQTGPPRPGEPWTTILEYTIQLAREVHRLTAESPGGER